MNSNLGNVTCTTADDTATAGADYVAINATLADATGMGPIMDDDGPVTEEFYIFLPLVMQ